MAQRKSTIARDSVFRRIGATPEREVRPVQGIPPTPPTRQTAAAARNINPRIGCPENKLNGSLRSFVISSSSWSYASVCGCTRRLADELFKFMANHPAP